MKRKRDHQNEEETVDIPRYIELKPYRLDVSQIKEGLKTLNYKVSGNEDQLLKRYKKAVAENNSKIEVPNQKQFIQLFRDQFTTTFKVSPTFTLTKLILTSERYTPQTCSYTPEKFAVLSSCQSLVILHI